MCSIMDSEKFVFRQLFSVAGNTFFFLERLEMKYLQYIARPPLWHLNVLLPPSFLSTFALTFWRFIKSVKLKGKVNERDTCIIGLLIFDQRRICIWRYLNLLKMRHGFYRFSSDLILIVITFQMKFNIFLLNFSRFSFNANTFCTFCCRNRLYIIWPYSGTFSAVHSSSFFISITANVGFGSGPTTFNAQCTLRIRSIEIRIYICTISHHVHVSVKRNQDRRETRTKRDVDKGREREREREKEKMYPSNQLDPGSCPFLVSTIRSFVVLLIDLSCWLRSSHLLRFSIFIFFFFPIQSLRNLFFIPIMYDQPSESFRAREKSLRKVRITWQNFCRPPESRKILAFILGRRSNSFVLQVRHRSRMSVISLCWWFVQNL